MYLKDFLILIKEKKNFTNIEIILWLIYYLGQQLKFILNNIKIFLLKYFIENLVTFS